jgi:hypothetical protein
MAGAMRFRSGAASVPFFDRAALLEFRGFSCFGFFWLLCLTCFSLPRAGFPRSGVFAGDAGTGCPAEVSSSIPKTSASRSEAIVFLFPAAIDLAIGLPACAISSR